LPPRRAKALIGAERGPIKKIADFSAKESEALSSHYSRIVILNYTHTKSPNHVAESATDITNNHTNFFD
jgi:hypothetical protein